MPKSVHLNAENPNQWVVIGVGVGVAGVLIATYYVLRFMLLWVVIGICIAADVHRRRQLRAMNVEDVHRRRRLSAMNVKDSNPDLNRLRRLKAWRTVKEDCGAMNFNLSRNKSVSIILEAIQEMEHDVTVEMRNNSASYNRILKEVINELRMMLDLLRDNDLGERSLLNHLVADFADIARHSADLVITGNIDETEKTLGPLRMLRKRVVELGGGEKVIRPQSVGEGVVVGLEKDVQQLCKVILNEEPGLVTSCIKGMLGVGKTTLARQVYNHAAIIQKFKRRRAWITLSSDKCKGEVFVELIQQLIELDGNSSLVEEMENRGIIEIICDHLRRIPCFIVLDNLLPEMSFESFCLRLRQIGNGSRLLITSRCKITTLQVYYTHEMKALDSNQSWKLFLKTIDKFTGHENKFPKDLESKGREMLKNCGGLPIAIINVGRQKAKERLSGIEWEEVFDSIDLSESLKLLEPMYDALDKYLKKCFLHMSFFKENAIMRDEKLEQIWDVSGLNTRSSAWTTGGLNSCTYDLSSQSIIEVLDPYQITNEVKRCRMNLLLHKLSVKKAEEEIGFEVLSINGNSRPSQNPCHRVIHCGREKFIQTTNQEKNLVSLIFHGGGRYLDDAGQSYWKNFKLLKMLDMEDFGVKTLSETMGTLIELRYLGLRNNYIQEIPHSLGGLKKLEVLDVALNFMVEIPGNIWEIGSLHHIYMSDVIYLEPLKLLYVLKNLKTLTYISIYDWMYELSCLEKMICLQRLGVEEVDENSDVGKLFASLAKLEHLRHLILRGFRFKSIPCLDNIGILDRLWTLKLDGHLSRLPSANNFPQRIKYLALVNTCLDEDPMPVLKKLPWLECLKMKNAYTGRKVSIQFSGFPDLLVLHINGLWNLRNVQVEEGAKAMLEQLEIKNCPHLETLPQEIGSMKRLRKFKMVTAKHIATKIRNSGLMSKIVEVDISS